jgi:hypothetical protein
MGARCTLSCPAPGAAALTGAVGADAREAVDQPVATAWVRALPLAAFPAAVDGEPAMVAQVGDRLLHAGQVQAAGRGEVALAPGLESQRNPRAVPVHRPDQPAVEPAVSGREPPCPADGGPELVAAGPGWPLARLIPHVGHGQPDRGEHVLGVAEGVAVHEGAAVSVVDHQGRVLVAVPVPGAGAVSGRPPAAVDAGLAPGRIERGDHPVKGCTHAAPSSGSGVPVSAIPLSGPA